VKNMQITNIHQAKSHLSKLVELAFEGEEVIICKAGKPMARLVGYQRDMPSRTPGYWKGKIRIAEDFDRLPEPIAAAFRGET
jgi:prevent-host-death family protein